jgi:hypothetical protein
MPLNNPCTRYTGYSGHHKQLHCDDVPKWGHYIDQIPPPCPSILSSRGVGQSVLECVVKHSVMLKAPVRNPRGQKYIHVKGWHGSGWVRSPSDFDGLVSPES